MVSGNLIKRAEWEYKLWLMVNSTTDIGKLIRKVAREFKHYKTCNMMESLKMIKKMEKVN
jgi:hypothetical protein